MSRVHTSPSDAVGHCHRLTASVSLTVVLCDRTGALFCSWEKELRVVLATPEQFFKTLLVFEARARSAQSRLETIAGSFPIRLSSASRNLSGSTRISTTRQIFGHREARLQTKADALTRLVDRIESIADPLISALSTSRRVTAIAETHINGRSIEETSVLVEVSSRTGGRDLNLAMGILNTRFSEIATQVLGDIERCLTNGALELPGEVS